MNQAEKDMLYLAQEVLPWLQHLERNRQREVIKKPTTKPVIIPKKNRRGLEKFI